MKKYILLFIVILLVSLLYFFIFQSSDPEEGQAGASQNTNNITATMPSLDSNIEAITEESKNIPEHKGSAFSEPSKENISLPDKSNSSPSVDANSKSRTDPIENMPSSYSVEDAEKYFLPPEERRPGHIGGPPPLSFPK